MELKVAANRVIVWSWLWLASKGLVLQFIINVEQLHERGVGLSKEALLIAKSFKIRVMNWHRFPGSDGRIQFSEQKRLRFFGG